VNLDSTRITRAHIAIERTVARPHHDAGFVEARPAEMPGAHFDPEGFRFVRASEPTAIVVRERRQAYRLSTVENAHEA
jgi:hypothetical protein